MLALLGLAAFRACITAMGAGFGLWLLRLRSTQLRLTCWTAVLTASLAMPLLQSVSPIQLAAIARLPLFVQTMLGAIGQFVALLQQTAMPKPNLCRVVLPLYLTGVAVLLLRLLLGLILSRRLLRRARLLELSGTRGVRIAISEAVGGPVTLGKTVLLPASCADWPEEKLLAVIAHERAHAGAGDFYVLLASQLARALFWFNPLSWWLHRRLAMLAEIASDEVAMATLGSRAAYARILFEFGRQPDRTVIGIPMARLASLERRIECILADATPTRAGVVERILVVLGVACIAALAAISAYQPREKLKLDVVAAYTPIRLEAGRLERFAGYYRDPRNGSLVIVARDGDHLTTHRAGLPPVPEYAYTDHDFFLTTVPQQNSFLLDPLGAVNGVMHRQNGKDELLWRIDDRTGRLEEAASQLRIMQERAAHVRYRGDPALLDAYAGRYQLDDGSTVIVSRFGDALAVQVGSHAPHAFLAYGPEDFFSTNAAAQISFEPGPAGELRVLILREDGENRRAVRPATP